MAGFITWASNAATEMVDTDLRHKNRTLDYLSSREIGRKSVYDIVEYIKDWWPRALKDKIVVEKLVEIVLQHKPRWSDEDASNMYDRTCELCKEDNENLRSIQYVFSHVPLLFFEKDALFHFFGQYSPHVRTYYQDLSPPQKAKYAAKALSLNGYLLRDVPFELIKLPGEKQGLYEIAVHTSPGAIQYVPEQNRTDDMMRNAVCKSAYVLEYLTSEKQDDFLEDAIMNPDDERETHWPSTIWHMVYHKVGNRAEPHNVKSGRAWLQNILNRVSQPKLISWYIAWHNKKKREANRQLNEQSMI